MFKFLKVLGKKRFLKSVQKSTIREFKKREKANEKKEFELWNSIRKKYDKSKNSIVELTSEEHELIHSNWR